jgi:hypothetical protein
MSMRVAREAAFGGADFATTRIRIPWSPDEGLFLFDQFGGATPLEIPLPPELVKRGMFPYVILSCFDGDTAFLAQRWFDRPIAGWNLLCHVGVDASSVCLTPRSVAEQISGDGLVEAENLVQNAPDLWAQVALDARPVLGVRITVGDGSYPLQIALDAAGAPLGWVLELGIAETS